MLDGRNDGSEIADDFRPGLKSGDEPVSNRVELLGVQGLALQCLVYCEVSVFRVEAYGRTSRADQHVVGLQHHLVKGLKLFGRRIAQIADNRNLVQVSQVVYHDEKSVCLKRTRPPVVVRFVPDSKPFA